MKTLIIKSNTIKLKENLIEFLKFKNQEVIGTQDSYDALKLIQNEKFDLIIIGETIALTECSFLLQACLYQDKSLNRQTPIKSLAKCNQTLKQIHRPNNLLSYYYSKNSLKRIQQSMQLEDQVKNNNNIDTLAV